MPVPDHVRDDGSVIQNILNSLDSGLRRNDTKKANRTFYECIFTTSLKTAYGTVYTTDSLGICIQMNNCRQCQITRGLTLRHNRIGCRDMIE